MKNQVESLEGFALAGLSIDCKSDDTSGIPALWEKFFPFMKKHFMDAPVTWGACLPNDDPQGFRYICGCPLADESAPEGLERFDVPACKYVVHPFNGLPQEMVNTGRASIRRCVNRQGLNSIRTARGWRDYRNDCYDEATGKITCDLYTPVK